MRKTVAAAGMAASLTIGGAAGAALFTPALSGAQTDESPDATEAPCEPHDGAGPRGFGFRGGIADALTDVLGLDADEIRNRMADGQSLADIAEAEGVDTQAVVDAIVAEHQERLDAAVDAGHLTEEQAAERADDLAEHAADMVERTPMLDGEGPHGMGRGMGRHGGGQGVGPMGSGGMGAGGMGLGPAGATAS
ncbi:MAG TPA: hypothetical protein VFU14_15995 [Acidimicrobiales bacterium]|nr:hypothetical protein [Acidimicrobiales bacterium]